MKIKIYFLALFVFLALDSLWLGLVAPRFYEAQIGHLMAASPNFWAAAAFYLIFIFGLVYFVVEPAMKGGESAFRRGAFFGLVAYATYDLTNQATLQGWPVLVTAVDIVWGVLICALAAQITVWLAKKLFK